jgi:opacity protein-like surface antigen
MLKKTIAATAVAMFAALPAVAGTVAPPVIEPMPTAPVVKPQSDWTGFYAGLNGAVGTTGGTTYWGGGVHAGYLYDSGDFVVGGEVSYNYVMSPATDHLFGADMILGYDAGNVMPHVTFGGSYLSGPALTGWSAGAGLSIKATDNVIVTGRYRYTYEPTGPNTLHQGIMAVSFQF